MGITVSTSMRPDQYQQVARCAETEGLTVSGLARKAITEYVERWRWATNETDKAGTDTT